MSTFDDYIAEYGIYLEDLKKRLLFVVKSFIAIFVIGFFMTGFIVKTLINFLDFENVSIVITSPFQMVDIAMSTGFFVSSVVLAPIIVYQIYTFLSPGLLPKEKRLFIFLIPVALVLFFIGFTYGFMILYFGISLIAEVNVKLGVVNYWDIGKFISDIVLTSSLLGIIFQFPIVTTFLVRIGVIDSSFLRNKRRVAYFLIFIFVSLLPPTDGLSLILMVVPMIVIYELTILVNAKYIHRNKLIQ
jgi:sec-independent protein translocase protein TatC